MENNEVALGIDPTIISRLDYGVRVTGGVGTPFEGLSVDLATVQRTVNKV